MSGFNFGSSTPSGGFSFGTPKTSATTATSGFSFGAGGTASSGGFSFGAATQTPASGQPTGLFSFSTPASSATPVSGFSFGTQATTATTQAPASGGLTFGTNNPKLSLGSGTQPAAGGFSIGGTSQTTQPSGGFSFGASSTQNQGSVSSGGGFSFTSGTGATSANNFGQPATSTGPTFGIPVSTVAAPTATSTQPATTFSLGAQAPASTQAIGSTPGPGLNFGSKPIDTSSAVVSTGPSTSTTQSLSSLLGSSGPSLFSSVATPIATASVTTATTGLTLASSTAGSAFGQKTLASSAASTGTLNTSTSLGIKSSLGLTGAVVQANAVGSVAGIGVNTPTMMTYAQLENLINKWSLELEDQEKHFLQQATQVNAWDRTLIQNGERITTLHIELEKVKLDQKRLDQELDFILSQQKELEDLLTPLEESVKEQSGTIYLQHADEEREKTYKLAENIDAQLKRMAQDLKDVIEHLNTSAGPGDSSNPLQQICKILNAHMDSLQWIDQNSALLQRKVEQVTKECENRRKEQERGFPILFD
ncbi:nuclear pore glycoprotein p62-like isoform 2-T2 [Rhinophrynus dorsalis]